MTHRLLSQGQVAQELTAGDPVYYHRDKWLSAAQFLKPPRDYTPWTTEWYGTWTPQTWIPRENLLTEMSEISLISLIGNTLTLKCQITGTAILFF